MYTAQSNVCRPQIQISKNVVYKATIRIITNRVGPDLITQICEYENGNALPDISILQRMEYMSTI
jgi:hypothetical protein